MAIKTTKLHSAMVVKFKKGVNASGKDIIGTQKYSKVKLDAKDEDILEVGNNLGGLLKYQVMEVLRADEAMIENAQ